MECWDLPATSSWQRWSSRCPLFSSSRSLLSESVPGWEIQNYQTSPWIEVILLWSILAYFYESLAECLAIWVKDKVLGMLLYLTYWISSFLFSIRGSLLAHLTIWCGWPVLEGFRLLHHTTPFSYYATWRFDVARPWRFSTTPLHSATTSEACIIFFSMTQLLNLATANWMNPLEPVCVKSGAVQGRRTSKVFIPFCLCLRTRIRW